MFTQPHKHIVKLKIRFQKIKNHIMKFSTDFVQMKANKDLSFPVYNFPPACGSYFQFVISLQQATYLFQFIIL